MLSEKDTGLLIRAVKFAAAKHRLQKRKDAEGTPYINHPIDVLNLLWNEGGVRDAHTLIAGVLHDTIEDTGTTLAELQNLFGPEVTAIVVELSDDKSLPKEDRKRLQIEHAPHKSSNAKLIKLADKISNVNDVANAPATDWSTERRERYLSWSEQVVNGVRGTNPKLEAHYDKALAEARMKLMNTKE